MNYGTQPGSSLMVTGAGGPNSQMHHSSSDNKNVFNKEESKNLQHTFLKMLGRRQADRKGFRFASNKVDVDERKSKDLKGIEEVEFLSDSSKRMQSWRRSLKKNANVLSVESNLNDLTVANPVQTREVSSSKINSFFRNFPDESSSTAPGILCNICLMDVPETGLYTSGDCGCQFCTECIKQYLRIKIDDGAISIPCLSSDCQNCDFISTEEIENLVGPLYADRFKTYQYLRQIEADPTRTWCPTPDCETVCYITACSQKTCGPVSCPKCSAVFCSHCGENWHPNQTCTEMEISLLLDGKRSLSSSEIQCSTIKRCPHCHIPIERLEGCSQMLCHHCLHVFCWFCLEPLQGDYLLLHYSNGPCKNLLGHSRSSLFWYRGVVIGVMALISVSVVLVSPLLLLSSPCIICIRCKFK